MLLLLSLHRKVFVLVFVGVAGAKPPAVKSLVTSGGSGGRLGPPTPRAALEYMAVMQDAVEHGGHSRYVAQELSPVFHRPVGSEQRAGAFVTAHDNLQQIFSRGQRQLAHAEVVDDQ